MDLQVNEKTPPSIKKSLGLKAYASITPTNKLIHVNEKSKDGKFKTYLKNKHEVVRLSGISPKLHRDRALSDVEKSRLIRQELDHKVHVLARELLPFSDGSPGNKKPLHVDKNSKDEDIILKHAEPNDNPPQMKFDNLLPERGAKLIGDIQISVDIKWVSFNGEKPIKGLSYDPLTLNLSDSHLHFASNREMMNGYAFKISLTLEKLYFSEHYILLYMKGTLGYFFVKHTGRDEKIRKYFKSAKYTRVDVTTQSDEDIKKLDISLKEDRHDRKEENQNDRGGINKDRSVKDDTSDKLDSGPSKLRRMIDKTDPLSSLNMNQQRSSRSRTSKGVSILQPDEWGENYYSKSSEPVSIDEPIRTDEVVERVEPAAFSPDLNYPFLSNKKITISYNDFKTLYNNDWINDSVIDFFIEYEIEQACTKKDLNLDPASILAFNSFFFTKLMSPVKTNDSKATTPQKEDSTTPTGEPIESPPVDSGSNYYQNIKRWLSKVDIMKYPYIIMPINDGAHWYCCIIRNLPTLLEEAKKIQGTIHLDSQDSAYESSPGKPTKKRKVVKQKHYAEIFLLDSFDYKHGNLNYPLTKFIIDYCKDKHDIEIVKEHFKIIRGKVPLQDNFNDCGIHVIYNVRQWLNNIDKCEFFWKRGNKRNDGITLGVVEGYVTNADLKRELYDEVDRNAMRKTLIAELLLLLDTQSQHQGDVSMRLSKSDNEDDDIEVLEEMPLEATDPNVGLMQTTSTVEEKRRSLDPRLLGSALSSEESPNSLSFTIQKSDELKGTARDDSNEEPKSIERKEHKEEYISSLQALKLHGTPSPSRIRGTPSQLEAIEKIFTESRSNSQIIENSHEAESPFAVSIAKTATVVPDSTGTAAVLSDSIEAIGSIVPPLNLFTDVQLIKEILNRDLDSNAMSALLVGSIGKVIPDNTARLQKVLEILNELVSDLLPEYKDPRANVLKVEQRVLQIQELLSQDDISQEDSKIGGHGKERHLIDIPSQENDSIVQGQENETIAIGKENETIDIQSQENETIDIQSQENETINIQSQENETIDIQSQEDDVNLNTLHTGYSDIEGSVDGVSQLRISGGVIEISDTLSQKSSLPTQARLGYGRIGEKLRNDKIKHLSPINGLNEKRTIIVRELSPSERIVPEVKGNHNDPITVEDFKRSAGKSKETVSKKRKVI